MFVQQPASQSHMSLPSKMLQVVVSIKRDILGRILYKDVEETDPDPWQRIPAATSLLDRATHIHTL